MESYDFLTSIIPFLLVKCTWDYAFYVQIRVILFGYLECYLNGPKANNALVSFHYKAYNNFKRYLTNVVFIFRSWWCVKLHLRFIFNFLFLHLGNFLHLGTESNMLFLLKQLVSKLYTFGDIGWNCYKITVLILIKYPFEFPNGCTKSFAIWNFERILFVLLQIVKNITLQVKISLRVSTEGWHLIVSV